MRTASLIAAAAMLAAGVALAQTAGAPQTPSTPPEIAAPKDAPFHGTIRLSIDATDTVRHIFRIHETIPAVPGPMMLLYPRWLPGTHAPSGRIDQLAGLTIRAGNTRLEWSRDSLDVFAFRFNVPAGATALDLDFQIVTATDPDQGRVVMTQDMLNLEWNAVALYPAGYYARQIMVEPAIRLPEGWQVGTALDTASANAGTTTFKPVAFDTLVDSPIFAGRNFKRIELAPDGPVRVSLDVVADRPELLDIKPEALEPHRQLVQQAYKLYGAHHYDHYDFLLSLSDQMGGIGLEHHRSSENGTVPTYFTECEKEPRHARSAVPRIYPFLERKIPPPGRSVDADLQCADARFPALGL